ncbi:MAG: tail fiber protein [Gammaproteobacteria bacterium]|nr:tail fiber protein [Gammaproteobacteria bacterium]
MKRNNSFTIAKKYGSVFLLVAGCGMSGIANACSTDGYIGSMNVFAGNFAIRGCAFAHGQVLQISENTALFSILGTTYGGDGRITFALPDTRGRSVIGAGTGPGLSTVELGQRGGAESVTLSVANLPAHSHTAATILDLSGMEAALNAYEKPSGPSGSGIEQYIDAKKTIFTDAVPNVVLSPMSIDIIQGSSTATTTVGDTGSGDPINVRNPYIGMNWLIQVTGIFPSRN